MGVPASIPALPARTLKRRATGPRSDIVVMIQTLSGAAQSITAGLMPPWQPGSKALSRPKPRFSSTAGSSCKRHPHGQPYPLVLRNQRRSCFVSYAFFDPRTKATPHCPSHVWLHRTGYGGPVAPQCHSQVWLCCQVPEVRSYCNAQVWFACAAQRPLVRSHRTGTRSQKRCSGSSALKQRFSHGAMNPHSAAWSLIPRHRASLADRASRTVACCAVQPCTGGPNGPGRRTALPLIASKHRSEAGAGAKRTALQLLRRQTVAAITYCLASIGR